MGRLDQIKRNIPKVSLDEYFWVIVGTPGIGKTSLFVELVKKHYGDVNAGLLLAFEPGYKALDLVPTDIEDWDDFEELADELIENKDKVTYKILGMDTADVMWTMVLDKVIREWNTQHPDRRTKEIGGVGAKGEGKSGFGEGYNRAKNKMQKVLNRLVKAGYGVVVITHSKNRKVEEQNGKEYDKLGTSISSAAQDVLINMADFAPFITLEREKEGDEAVNKRYIYWRDNGYIEAKCRFDNVPVRTEYGNTAEEAAVTVLEIFKNAVLEKFGNKKNVEKAEKEQKKEKEEQTKKFREKAKESLTNDEIIEEMNKLVKGLDKKEREEVATKLKEKFNTANYKNLDEEQLKEAYELVIKYNKN